MDVNLKSFVVLFLKDCTYEDYIEKEDYEIREKHIHEKGILFMYYFSEREILTTINSKKKK